MGKKELKMKKFAAVSLVILIILNLLDAVFTIYGIEMGLIIETNPLMVEALEVGRLYFVVGKVALVNLGAWLLWRWLHYRLAQFCAVLGTVVYAGIFCWHLWGLML